MKKLILFITIFLGTFHVSNAQDKVKDSTKVYYFKKQQSEVVKMSLYNERHKIIIENFTEEMKSRLISGNYYIMKYWKDGGTTYCKLIVTDEKDIKRL